MSETVVIGDATLYLGDCREVLAGLAADSVHAVVADPPYDLLQGSRRGSRRTNDPAKPHGRHDCRGGGFMGLDWDATGVAFRPETWAEALRVARPGAPLLAFGGTRSWHRLVCALEDAGWQIRDCLCWLYGQGFPKSRNFGKDLEDGWAGYGTALKPAWEPIVLAMKPLDGTFAENAQKWGVAGLNIDGCRLAIADNDDVYAKNPHTQGTIGANGIYGEGKKTLYAVPSGRWPANVALDAQAAAMLDEQSGTSVSRGGQAGLGAFGTGEIYGKGRIEIEKRDPGFGDSGGASRFFYCAKAARQERNAGIEWTQEGWPRDLLGGLGRPRSRLKDRRVEADNWHPTVKPLDLMRWLCRLVRPPAGGVVLDPFLGSGTTLCAAALEGMGGIGIEQDAQYLELARPRITHWQAVAAEEAGLFRTDAEER